MIVCGKKQVIFFILTGQTNLPQDKLYITELTVFPQFAIVLMKCALWITRKLGKKIIILIKNS